MNYRRIYDTLIAKGKARELEGYSELHHIVPRCMGGSEDIENLVRLTPEEHYVAHQLLVKIYPDNKKILRAAIMMRPRRPNNKLYGWLRRKYSALQKESTVGENNSQYGTMWISNGTEEKKMPKNKEIPAGWLNCRISSFLKKKLQKEPKIKKVRVIKQKIVSHISWDQICEIRRLYNIYREKGFEGVKNTGYAYSHPNLCYTFRCYVPEFVPRAHNRHKKKNGG